MSLNIAHYLCLTGTSLKWLYMLMHALATAVVFNSPDGTISVKFLVDVKGWPGYLMP